MEVYASHNNVPGPKKEIIMEAMLAFISLVLLMFYREREKYPIVETLTLWYIAVIGLYFVLKMSNFI